MKFYLLFSNFLLLYTDIITVLVILAFFLVVLLLRKSFITLRIVSNDILFNDESLEIVRLLNRSKIMPDPFNLSEKVTIPFKQIVYIQRNKVVNIVLYIRLSFVTLALLLFITKMIDAYSNTEFISGDSPEAISDIISPALLPIILLYFFIRDIRRLVLYPKSWIYELKLRNRSGQYRYIQLLTVHSPKFEELRIQVKSNRNKREASDSHNQEKVFIERTSEEYKSYSQKQFTQDMNDLHQIDPPIIKGKDKKSFISWRPYPFQKMHKGYYRLFLLFSFLILGILFLFGYSDAVSSRYDKKDLDSFYKEFSVVVLVYCFLAVLFRLIYIWLRKGFADEKQ